MPGNPPAAIQHAHSTHTLTSSLPACCCLNIFLPVCPEELESLTVPPPVEQLERAKAMSISLIQGALESKAASAEDLGRQILTYGHR